MNLSQNSKLQKLHKKNCLSNVSNYRSISLLCHCQSYWKDIVKAIGKTSLYQNFIFFTQTKLFFLKINLVLEKIIQLVMQLHYWLKTLLMRLKLRNLYLAYFLICPKHLTLLIIKFYYLNYSTMVFAVLLTNGCAVISATDCN